MSQLSQYVEKWLAGELELAPITKLLGVRPVSLGEGEARIELTADKRLHNAMGTVHGGILCDLADVAMGAALATITAEGESFSTLQLQMSYFLPVVEGRLSAHARVVRRGRGTAHLECDLEDGEGRVVARGTSVCAIRQ
jgi:uncharacterized protein (TIGR00369 family)